MPEVQAATCLRDTCQATLQIPTTSTRFRCGGCKAVQSAAPVTATTFKDAAANDASKQDAEFERDNGIDDSAMVVVCPYCGTIVPLRQEEEAGGWPTTVQCGCLTMLPLVGLPEV